VAGAGVGGPAGVGGAGGGVGGGVNSAQSAQDAAAAQCGPDQSEICAQPYYSIQAIYFNPKLYPNVADCLTAAHASRLPLDLCR
jgi:hypothetical protein